MIDLQKKLGFRPRNAVWELTLRCNIRCLHCASRAGKKRDDELSLHEALKLCDELIAMGCRRLTLGGGEPLLREDWPIIAEKLICGGVSVNIVTNGLAWTDKITHLAKAIGLDSAGFSFDGLEENHDLLRGHPGLWRKVLGAFDSCRRVGLPANAVTTILRKNVGELEPMREVLREHGVRQWQLQIGTATGNLSDNRELVMQPEEMRTLVPFIASMCRDGKLPHVRPSDSIGYYGEPEEKLRSPKSTIPFWIGCPAGLSVIGIESDGGIKGCLSLPSAMNGQDRFLEGNVRERSLKEIWFREGAFAYNREFKIDNLGGFCRTCDYAEVCRGGCTWRNVAQDVFVRDNSYCFWRQSQLAEANDHPTKAEVRRLPVVS